MLLGRPRQNNEPRSGFTHLARRTARAVGRRTTIGLGVLIILLRAVTEPIFHFSDTWGLVINTITTMLTLLMVFLI